MTGELFWQPSGPAASHSLPCQATGTVPAGLQELSGPLDALIEFLEIDEDLVDIAAQASSPLAAGPSRKELSAWIRGLPEKDKNEFLITAVVEQGGKLTKDDRSTGLASEGWADYWSNVHHAAA
jgi:hypothetical protein